MCVVDSDGSGSFWALLMFLLKWRVLRLYGVSGCLDLCVLWKFDETVMTH